MPRFRRLLARSALPETICALPWVNLTLDVDGTSRPCCKFAHLTPDSRYQLANLQDQPLDQVWNSPAMQRLRTDFRAGKKPKECSACWDEEAAGIRSFRQSWTTDRGIPDTVDYDNPTPAAPMALDLKLSNRCNLRCRICGPVASSLWLNEELHVAETDPEYARREQTFLDYLRKNKRYLLANKVTEVPSNLATMKRWVSHIRDVEMTGGEPMLSPENREIIELIVAEGRPRRTNLVITTNATIIDERIIQHFEALAKVTVSISIDDIGARLTYERSPVMWETVQANIDRYAELVSDKVQVLLNCTVSTLNVWYLPEFVRWVSERYPDGRIRLSEFNMVHSPDHYSLRSIPSGLQDSIARRITAEVLDTEAPDSLKQRFQAVLDYMRLGTPRAANWQAFVDETARRDAIRDESFASTFPEFDAEIARLGLWPTVSTAVGAPRRGAPRH